MTTDRISSLCRTAACIEVPEPGDTLCETHLRYVMEVVAFIDGSAPGIDFDSCRASWAILLAEEGITLLPVHVAEQRAADALADYDRRRALDSDS